MWPAGSAGLGDGADGGGGARAPRPPPGPPPRAVLEALQRKRMQTYVSSVRAGVLQAGVEERDANAVLEILLAALASAL